MQKIFLKCEIPQLIICHQMYFVLRTNRLQIGRNNYCNFVYFLRNCFQIFRETRNLSKKCESVNYPTTLSWLSAPRILCNATIYISDRDMDLIGGQSVTLQLNVLFRRGTVLPVSIHHGGFFLLARSRHYPNYISIHMFYLGKVFQIIVCFSSEYTEHTQMRNKHTHGQGPPTSPDIVCYPQT